jgi:mRNA-degrading endonuclease RelE of RelBE toxin-antitoxin system
MALVTIREEAYSAGELELIPAGILKVALRKLRDRPDAGKPLERVLKGCRSLRVGDGRIVYRHYLERDEVQVIAIGRRREDEVYASAEGRV